MYENYTITRQQNYKDYERIMFCIKALGNENDPDFTHYLHVENGRNGSRLNSADCLCGCEKRGSCNAHSHRCATIVWLLRWSFPPGAHSM